MKHKNQSKTKNETCQKIKLYGSLTTKELKKKHSSRLVARRRQAARAERMPGKVVAGGLGDITFACG